jgi:hypothetical protein
MTKAPGMTRANVNPNGVPTIRAEGSQIWACWNPKRKSDAIDEFLRAKKPDNATVVKANWRENPWFPPELEAERQLDLQLYPERYATFGRVPSRAPTSPSI